MNPRPQLSLKAEIFSQSAGAISPSASVGVHFPFFACQWFKDIELGNIGQNMRVISLCIGFVNSMSYVKTFTFDIFLLVDSSIERKAAI